MSILYFISDVKISEKWKQIYPLKTKFSNSFIIINSILLFHEDITLCNFGIRIKGIFSHCSGKDLF